MNESWYDHMYSGGSLLSRNHRIKYAHNPIDWFPWGQEHLQKQIAIIPFLGSLTL